MTLTRQLSRWISGSLTVALLFMQLATAAYACPRLSRAADEVIAIPDCHTMAVEAMDPVQPQLCKAHCSPEDQSPAAAAAPDLLAHPTALLLRVVEPTPVDEPALAHSGAAPWLLPPIGPPPLYLSLLVLRN